jgi:hypothetical protein
LREGERRRREKRGRGRGARRALLSYARKEQALPLKTPSSTTHT